jgi:hypothetical protein
MRRSRDADLETGALDRQLIVARFDQNTPEQGGDHGFFVWRAV